MSDVGRPQNVATMTSSMPYVSAFLWIWYLKDPKTNSPRIVASTSVASSQTGMASEAADDRIDAATTAQAATNMPPAA